jgi:hypothetical protein|tara:strand:- start:536 stop:748 length:213 start_codon:yes stop_codon:yes gene_type:complete
MEKIKYYPQNTTTYKVVHLDEQNKVKLESPIFETLIEAKDFANENKTCLGIGVLNWRIMMIMKSLINLDK